MAGRKGRSGRPRNPDNVVQLRGTRRTGDRATKPTAKPKNPARCPAWLSPQARNEWRRLAPELKRLGLLSSLDVAPFAALCTAYADLRAAREAIDKAGILVDGPKGTKVRNPALMIERAAIEQVRRLSIEFGLTPAARARVTEIVPLGGRGGGGTTTPEGPKPNETPVTDRLGRPC